MTQGSVAQYPAQTQNRETATTAIEEYSILFNSFFGFREFPFNNTPDPNFFFRSRQHEEALMSMIFGIEQRRGFIVVTGEIGAGKTTLCRHFLNQLSPSVRTAVILNPNLSGSHLLASIVKDFGITAAGDSKKNYFDALNDFLIHGLENNQNTCVIIDEAQCLNPKVLEEVRLLTNLETTKQKLLQVVLTGQPELKDVLLKPALKQLRQRVGVSVHLKGLEAQETGDYIQSRLHYVQEGEQGLMFHEDVVVKIHELSRGIPRLVNAICDRILMAAFARQTKEVTMEVAQSAFDEMAFVCA